MRFFHFCVNSLLFLPTLALVLNDQIPLESSVVPVTRPVDENGFPANVGVEPTYQDFSGWREDDKLKAKLRQVKFAVADAYLMAQFTLEAFNDDLFGQYFGSSVEKPRAMQILQKIVNGSGKGLPLMSSISIEREGADQTRCQERPKPLAYTAQRGAAATIVICDAAWQFGSLTGTDAVQYKDLSTRISYRMHTLAYIVFHEITHFRRVSNGIYEAPPGAESYITDWNEAGYGCFNSRNLSPAIAPRTRNADTWAWFVNANYWHYYASTSRLTQLLPATLADQKDPRCSDLNGSGSCTIS